MNYILSKDWNPELRAEVWEALADYDNQLRSVSHPYAATIDLEFAQANVSNGNVPGVVVDSYLILYAIAPPWFSPVPMFVELMLMKLPSRPKGNFELVHECMEDIASDNGCSVVVVGNAYLRKGLSRKYISAGYAHTNMELIKEIPNG